MLSALRLSVMRTASTAAKPCQEDSSEFYLITGSIYTDPRNRGDIANHIDEVTKTLSDELLKLKNFKKDATLKLFKSTNQERFNDSLLGARVRKIKGRTYNLLPRRHVYEAILRKKITRKEDIGGNFKIPYNIRGLKHINALVDQGSDVNIMPLSTYMKLTDERPVETDIRLSLASHSYIYPLGIAEDILVKVAEHVYPVDFVILDIKEDEKRPFILGTPFLTTTKAVIKFNKGTITLRSRKSKISFYRIPKSLCFYAEFSSDLTNKIACKKFLIKNGEEIFTDAGDGVKIYPDGVASPAM
ncbi:zinc finger, CCHC-type containing protein [Tanacetum coccineum]